MEIIDRDWLWATLCSGSNGLLVGMLLGDGSLHGQERVVRGMWAMIQLLATLTQHVGAFGAVCHGM